LTGCSWRRGQRVRNLSKQPYDQRSVGRDNERAGRKQDKPSLNHEGSISPSAD